MAIYSRFSLLGRTFQKPPKISAVTPSLHSGQTMLREPLQSMSPLKSCLHQTCISLMVAKSSKSDSTWQQDGTAEKSGSDELLDKLDELALELKELWIAYPFRLLGWISTPFQMPVEMTQIFLTPMFSSWSPEDAKLLSVFAGTFYGLIFTVGFAIQLFFVSDRRNTYVNLCLSAWLLAVTLFFPGKIREEASTCGRSLLQLVLLICMCSPMNKNIFEHFVFTVRKLLIFFLIFMQTRNLQYAFLGTAAFSLK